MLDFGFQAKVVDELYRAVLNEFNDGKYKPRFDKLLELLDASAGVFSSNKRLKEIRTKTMLRMQEPKTLEDRILWLLTEGYRYSIDIILNGLESRDWLPESDDPADEVARKLRQMVRDGKAFSEKGTFGGKNKVTLYRAEK